MTRKNLLLAGAGCLILSLAMNWRALDSCLLDMDSFNAMTVFCLGRVGLGRMLRWLASSVGFFSSYEPVTNFCYWLIYVFLKAQGPQGFRWLKLVLQAADSFLVGWIAARWLRQQRWAVLAGLIYLLHPMHESSSCVGVPHYLAAFFVLCGFLLHSGRWEKRNAGTRTAGLCAAYFLAAFSKESGALFPLFLLCFDASASPRDASAADFWRKRLVPYFCLSLVALFYAWVRSDLLSAGAHAGSAIEAGRRLGEALRASRYAPLLPIALALPLIARKQVSGPYFARAAFCAAWFILGILPVLDLLPVKFPQHFEAINSRYLILPTAGLAWLAALVLDLCARRWGSRYALLLALVALVPILPGLSRMRAHRDDEIAAIERGLARCASPIAPNWECVPAALSLPLVRRQSPEAIERMTKTLAGLWPRERAEAFVQFFAGGPFDGSAPKWRCLAQAMLERSELENCIEADRAFRVGSSALQERRYAASAAAFDAATAAWPYFAEAFFQKARALSLARDENGAAQSYDRALHCPMAYYLLGALLRDHCGLREGETCRFLDKIDTEQSVDLFQATGQTWLGTQRTRKIPLPLEELRKRSERKPQDIDLWLDLASAAGAQNQCALALDALARAEKLSADRERLVRIALLYQDSRDYASTVRIMSRLIENFPFDARYWNDRAVAKLMINDAPGAVRDLDHAVSADPDLLSAYLTLGGVELRLGRPEKARRVYQAALKRPVRRGEPQGMRRMIREELGRINLRGEAAQ